MGARTAAIEGNEVDACGIQGEAGAEIFYFPNTIMSSSQQRLLLLSPRRDVRAGMLLS